MGYKQHPIEPEGGGRERPWHGQGPQSRRHGGRSGRLTRFRGSRRQSGLKTKHPPPLTHTEGFREKSGVLSWVGGGRPSTDCVSSEACRCEARPATMGSGVRAGEKEADGGVPV